MQPEQSVCSRASAAAQSREGRGLSGAQEELRGGGEERRRLGRRAGLKDLHKSTPSSPSFPPPVWSRIIPTGLMNKNLSVIDLAFIRSARGTKLRAIQRTSTLRTFSQQMLIWLVFWELRISPIISKKMKAKLIIYAWMDFIHLLWKGKHLLLIKYNAYKKK